VKTKSCRRLCFVLAVLLLTLASAQDARIPKPSAVSETVPVTQLFFAEHDDGRLAGPITPSNLKIIDGNKPAQSILAIRAANELPLRLGLLIDTSNSQGKNRLYRPLTRAALDFLDQVASVPDADVFIVSFDRTPDISKFMAHDELTKFTPDLVTGGGTALFDAIYAACKERMAIDPQWPARRVLVILSDGADNSSHVSLSAALAAAQQTRAAIFVVDTGEAAPIGVNERTLSLLAEGTGGLAYLHPGSDTTKVLAEIRRQIENMYLVTYVPAGTTKQRSYHSFKLMPASDKNLRLRSPLGFYTGTKSR